MFISVQKLQIETSMSYSNNKNNRLLSQTTVAGYMNPFSRLTSVKGQAYERQH